MRAGLPNEDHRESPSPPTVQIPADIQPLCQALLAGLEAILGDKLFGVYLYGAIAFPEGGATGDIDFHVILHQAPNDQLKSELSDLHARLARDYPPLGAELDGYYLLLADARRTTQPAHQLLPGVVDNSWALHRAHIRAGRCIVLRGPDPRTVYPPTSWPELASDLEGELEYVRQHLADYPAYCVLNLCRLMYSFETGDVVVSKRASANWARDLFTHWRRLIDAARNSYDQQASAQEQQLLSTAVKRFFDFACEQIDASRAGPDADRGPGHMANEQ